MKALLPLLFFIIYCQFIPANVNAAKQHKAEYRLKDTVLVLDLIKKARESLYQSLDSAFIYAKKAIKISGKIGYTKGKGWGYHRISQAFDVLGSSDSAFKYGNIAQQYLRSINDSLGLAHSLYTFGNIYLYKSWYEAALKYYFDANVIYQKLK
jgi:hypothetical protein